MKINKESYLRVTFFLMVVILPLSMWVNFLLSPKISAITPWREFISIILPIAYLIIFNVKFKKNIFYLYGILFLIFSVPLFKTILCYPITLKYFLFGLIPYLTIPILVLFFTSLNRKYIINAFHFIKIGLLVGGLGLIIDFTTDYYFVRTLISKGLSNLSFQTGIVPRASFLFGRPNQAATILILMMNIIFLEYLFCRQNSKKNQVLTIVSLIVGVLGTLTTYSRIGILFIFIYALIYVFYKRKFLVTAISIFLIISFSSSQLKHLNSDQYIYLVERVLSISASSDSEEDIDLGRSSKMKQGLFDLEKNFFFGRYVGSGNPRNQDFQNGITHYENTILWVFNEAGIAGFLIAFSHYMLPFFIVFRRWYPFKKKVILLFLLFGQIAIIGINPGGMGFINLVLSIFSFSIFYHFLFLKDFGDDYQINLKNKLEI